MVKVSDDLRVIRAIDDPCSRHILCLTNGEAKSAKELSDACELSLPSTYRRLNRLCESDLLNKRTHVNPEGHHYKLYESDVVSIEVFFTDDEPRVLVKSHRDVLEEYISIWDRQEQSQNGPEDEDA